MRILTVSKRRIGMIAVCVALTSAAGTVGASTAQAAEPTPVSSAAPAPTTGDLEVNATHFQPTAVTQAKAAEADPTVGWEKDTPAADGLVHRGKWTIDPKSGIQYAPASNSYDCLANYACFFQNANYNDSQSGWIERYHDVQFATSLIHNDQMSSWWNRRSCRSEWNDANFIEHTYNMPAGNYVSYVGDGANDTATWFSNISC